MYKNIRVISLPDKQQASIAIRSIIGTIDAQEAEAILKNTPGIILRGVFTPHAKKIKEALEITGAKVILE
jgi:ribosomal protein L7/L12